jgi:hypothetical protein
LFSGAAAALAFHEIVLQIDLVLDRLLTDRAPVVEELHRLRLHLEMIEKLIDLVFESEDRLSQNVQAHDSPSLAW